MEGITPIGERIIVSFERKNETESGIFLAPDSNKPKNEGDVVAVGDGEKVSSLFKIGDVVVCRKGYGDRIDDDNKDLVIIDIDHVLAIKK